MQRWLPASPIGKNSIVLVESEKQHNIDLLCLQHFEMFTLLFTNHRKNFGLLRHDIRLVSIALTHMQAFSNNHNESASMSRCCIVYILPSVRLSSTNKPTTTTSKCVPAPLKGPPLGFTRGRLLNRDKVNIHDFKKNATSHLQPS